MLKKEKYLSGSSTSFSKDVVVNDPVFNGTIICLHLYLTVGARKVICS